MDQSRIDRINALYHKAQATGLTEEEKGEQEALRKEYIEAIRNNMRANLNNISIKEKDGTVTDLGKKFGGVEDADLQEEKAAEEAKDIEEVKAAEDNKES